MTMPMITKLYYNCANKSNNSSFKMVFKQKEKHNEYFQNINWRAIIEITTSFCTDFTQQTYTSKNQICCATQKMIDK